MQRIFPITLTLTLLTLSACSKKEAEPIPIRAVKVVQAGNHAQNESQAFSAEIRAAHESRLSFRVSGKILSRNVEIGQVVRKGQLLAQLDPKDYQLGSQAVQAQVSAAIANRDVLRSDVQRYRDLHQQNFISKAELQHREAALSAAQGQLDQLQAQQKVQHNQAMYSSLYSDVSGVVTFVDGEVGQVVSAGSPVVRIAQDGSRDAVFAVSESLIQSFVHGVPVKVVQKSTGQSWPAQIRETAASADPISRTFTIKARIESATPPPIGSTVSVLLPAVTAGDASIALPLSALKYENHKSYVWIVDKTTMRVRLQEVQVNGVQANEVSISSGVQTGDLVVSAGIHILNAQEKVKLYQARNTTS